LYQATSKIAVSPENPDILGFRNVGDEANSYDFDEDLETEAAILRSDALASKVISDIRLDRDSRFSGSKPPLNSDDVIFTSNLESDPSKIAGMLGAFRGGLTVQVIPGSRLIQVSYTHPDARLSAEIANALVKAFIEENFKTKYESVTQTSDWLTKQLADLQLRMQTSEEKLVRYQRDHGIVGVDEKQNIVTSKLDELNRELTAAESDRIQKEADYRLAVEGEPGAFSKVSSAGGDSLIDKLQERTTDLDTQLAQATTEFGSGYPKVSELKNQLKQVQSEIVEERKRIQINLRDKYLAAAEQERLLREEFEQQKKQANQLNENAIEYSLLKRDADSNRELYQSLQQKLKEAGVSAGLKSSNIRVVDVAQTPTSSISPNVRHSLSLGFLLGLGAGIGLAFVLENLDRTVRNVEELSATSALPVLGAIPLQVASHKYLRKRLAMMPNASVKPESPVLVAYLRPKSQAAEAFRALRTSILLSTFDAPSKVIMITSPLPREGKTTVGANTALVLAQAGSRVLLVDADLRRPGLAKMLGLKATGGLSSLIGGIDNFEEVVVRFSKVPTLWMLPAGPVPPQSAELLGSDQMKKLISSWREEFDYVVIDTPPCLSVTDAAVLSAHADRTLLVARAGQTQKPTIQRACSLLLQVNAKGIGVVLNAFDVRAESYYYGNQYSGQYYEEISPYNGSLGSEDSNSSSNSITSKVS